MDIVFDFLEKELILKENDVIVLGNSYGPDSMALLNILLKIRKKINISIIVAHVNHNLRKESAQEKLDLEKFCFDNNLTLLGYLKALYKFRLINRQNRKHYFV